MINQKELAIHIIKYLQHQIIEAKTLIEISVDKNIIIAKKHEIEYRTKLIAYFNESGGECAGYSTLWSYSKYIDDSITVEYTKNAMTNMALMSSIKLLSNSDNFHSLTNAENLELDLLISNILQYQKLSIDLFYGEESISIKQLDLTRTLEDTQGRKIKEVFADNIAATKNILAEKLCTVVKPKTLIFIGAANHMMSIYLDKQGELMFFDPNGFCESMESISALVDKFFDCSKPDNFTIGFSTTRIVDWYIRDTTLKIFSFGDTNENDYPSAEEFKLSYFEVKSMLLNTSISCLDEPKVIAPLSDELKFNLLSDPDLQDKDIHRKISASCLQIISKLRNQKDFSAQDISKIQAIKNNLQLGEVLVMLSKLSCSIELADELLSACQPERKDWRPCALGLVIAEKIRSGDYDTAKFILHKVAHTFSILPNVEMITIWNDETIAQYMNQEFGNQDCYTPNPIAGSQLFMLDARIRIKKLHTRKEQLLQEKTLTPAELAEAKGFKELFKLGETLELLSKASCNIELADELLSACQPERKDWRPFALGLVIGNKIRSGDYDVAKFILHKVAHTFSILPNVETITRWNDEEIAQYMNQEFGNQDCYTPNPIAGSQLFMLDARIKIKKLHTRKEQLLQEKTLTPAELAEAKGFKELFKLGETLELLSKASCSIEFADELLSACQPERKDWRPFALGLVIAEKIRSGDYDIAKFILHKVAHTFSILPSVEMIIRWNDEKIAKYMEQEFGNQDCYTPNPITGSQLFMLDARIKHIKLSSSKPNFLK